MWKLLGIVVLLIFASGCADSPRGCSEAESMARDHRNYTVLAGNHTEQVVIESFDEPYLVWNTIEKRHVNKTKANIATKTGEHIGSMEIDVGSWLYNHSVGDVVLCKWEGVVETYPMYDGWECHMRIHTPLQWCNETR